MVFEGFSGDWVSVGGARKLIEADGHVGCMTLPIVPNGLRQEIELLEVGSSVSSPFSCSCSNHSNQTVAVSVMLS